VKRKRKSCSSSADRAGERRHLRQHQINQRGIVSVQTGSVLRQDLTATVNASGEIKPKNYINLSANTFGPAPITEIMVKEATESRKARSSQSWSRYRPMLTWSRRRPHRYISRRFGCGRSRSQIHGGRHTHRASYPGSLQGGTPTHKSNLDRAVELYKAQLLARQDYDQKKAEYDTAVAAIGEPRPAWRRQNRRKRKPGSKTIRLRSGLRSCEPI